MRFLSRLLAPAAAPSAVLKPLMAATRAAIDRSTVYASEVLNEEVVRYFTALGMDTSYFRLYPAEDIAHHIQGFIAAKRMAALSNVESGDQLFFKIKKPNNASDVVYFCADVPHLILKAEEEIQKDLLLAKRPGWGYSIRSHVSDGPHTEGQRRLCVYDITWSEYPTDTQTTGFAAVCTKAFSKTKPADVAERYSEVYSELCKNQKLRPVVRFIDGENTDSGHALVLVAYGTRSKWYLPAISLLAEELNIRINRKYIETFEGGTVEVHAMYVDAGSAPKDLLKQFTDNVTMLGLVPVRLHENFTQAFLKKQIDARSLLYVHAITTFAYYFTENLSAENVFLKRFFESNPQNLSRLQRMSDKLWKEAITMDRIVTLAVDNMPLMRLLYDDFLQKTTTPGSSQKVSDAVISAITLHVQNPTEAVIFQSFIAFNESVVKTNFHKEQKSAISFRIDTSFMRRLEYTEVPHGLFMFVGSTFTGFHIRFRDIARGGVRLVSPLTDQAHKLAFKSLIQENLNLALTQQRKNKDIPEGGSKGIFIVSPAATQSMRETAYLQYVDALCDVIIADQPNVIDRLGKEEMIFLGPDENTGNFEFPDKAMNLAEARGYPFYKSFTTGKSPHSGGIPHDLYGMTTMGVVEFKACIRETQNIKDEKAVKKVQTGGPNGDLGGNEIKMSSDKTIAVVDFDAVLYDPNGLDRTELMRLVDNRLTAKAFNKKALTCKEAFVVTCDDAGVKLPDGIIVEKFDSFRDTFMFYPQAEFFVPCGGRPKAINLTNVHRFLLDPKGLTGNVMMQTKSDDLTNLRYRYIVEGANLYLTPEARVALENYGVILFPDQSVNKGGVTSSSYEVFAALAMSRDEHNALMLLPKSPPNAQPSAFFVKYVAGIHTIIKRNARREYEAIEKEHKRLEGKVVRSVLANELSLRMNIINTRILTNGLWKDFQLREKVLKKALPPVLLENIPIDVIMKRVPEAYQAAIFNAYVASNFVYSVGLEVDESAFSRFMHSLA